MEYDIIVKARLRQADAKNHLERLKNLNSIAVEERHASWNGFIIAINSIFEILFSGAKSHNKAKDFLGKKKKFIKNDDLLLCMKEARASDYHGTRNSIGIFSGNIEAAYIGDISVSTVATDGSEINKSSFVVFRGGPMNIGAAMNFKTILLPVYNELHNTKFDVPKTHKGIDLQSNEAVTAGELTYAFYSSLIDDFESMFF